MIVILTLICALVYVLGFAYTWGATERENYSEEGGFMACVTWPGFWVIILLVNVYVHTVVRLVKWFYRKGLGS